MKTVLYATPKGSVGVIGSLDKENYLILKCLQDTLTDFFPQTETLNLFDFRKPEIQGY